MHLVTDVVAFEPMPAKGVQGIGSAHDRVRRVERLRVSFSNFTHEYAGHVVFQIGFQSDVPVTGVPIEMHCSGVLPITRRLGDEPERGEALRRLEDEVAGLQVSFLCCHSETAIGFCNAMDALQRARGLEVAVLDHSPCVGAILSLTPNVLCGLKVFEPDGNGGRRLAVGCGRRQGEQQQ